MDYSIQWVVRLFLSGIFLTSLISKLLQPAVFIVKMRKYNILPKSLVPVMGWAFILWEAMIVIGLLGLGDYLPKVAIAILGLLAVFSYAIAVNVSRGNLEIDCGCFGFLSSGQKIGWNLVIRNAFLAVFALALFYPVSVRSMGWGDFTIMGFALTVLGLLYLSYHELFTLYNRQVSQS